MTGPKTVCCSFSKGGDFQTVGRDFRHGPRFCSLGFFLLTTVSIQTLMVGYACAYTVVGRITKGVNPCKMQCRELPHRPEIPFITLPLTLCVAADTRKADPILVSGRVPFSCLIIASHSYSNTRGRNCLSVFVPGINFIERSVVPLAI